MCGRRQDKIPWSTDASPRNRVHWLHVRPVRRAQDHQRGVRWPVQGTPAFFVFRQFALGRGTALRLPEVVAKQKWVPLETIVEYCNRALGIPDFPDYDGAWNGLQVENDGRVHRLAAAVDASATTLRLAAEAGADLLLVHHGLFWSLRQPWTGANRQLWLLLSAHNLAVYSAHLPLDAHPRWGNNRGLCAALGWRPRRRFFLWKGRPIGWEVHTRLSRAELHRKLEQAVGGPVRLLACGPDPCRRIGIVTGGAGSELRQAAVAGLDTFITGEGPHWTHALAEELGLNVFYAGHYATETFGVKALAAHLSRRFGLSWVFLDHPSGL
jgi:dinuclear metal center YbgI/SA1388 family protein